MAMLINCQSHDFVKGGDPPPPPGGDDKIKDNTHRSSVTVSMGDERKGAFRRMLRVTRTWSETSCACLVSHGTEV